MAETTSFIGTGRRKNSIARVRLVNGNGKITVNSKDLEEYLSHVNKDGSSDFSEFLNSQYEQNDFIMAVVNAELNEIGRGVSSGRN